MPNATMPGRVKRVIDRNCYMRDADNKARAEFAEDFRRRMEDSSHPATVWCVIVAMASVGCFLVGVYLGSRV